MNKKTVLVSIGLFIDKADSNPFRLWMQKRTDKGSRLDGKWEFPGGKLEAGEMPKEALIREIHEEVGLKLLNPDKIFPFSIIPYQYEDKCVCLHTFLIFEENLPKEAGKWYDISYEEMSAPLEGLIPPINHKIIDALIEYLKIINEPKNISYLKLLSQAN